MISRLFAFVWLGAAVSVFCGICAAAVGVAAGVAWLAGEVDASWTPIQTHTPARIAVIGAVTKNRVLYRLLGLSEAFSRAALVSLLVIRAPGDGRWIDGQ